MAHFSFVLILIWRGSNRHLHFRFPNHFRTVLAASDVAEPSISADWGADVVAPISTFTRVDISIGSRQPKDAARSNCDVNPELQQRLDGRRGRRVDEEAGADGAAHPVARS